MKRIILSSIAILAVTSTTAFAAASSGYRGKTKSGTTITFKVSGNRISGVKTQVPMVCVETTGSGQTRAGVELYEPPASFAIGATSQTKALQRAAMNQGIKATKTYTFSSSRAGAKITGKLRISLSFLRPGYDIYHSYIFLCTGTTTFSASAA